MGDTVQQGPHWILPKCHTSSCENGTGLQDGSESYVFTLKHNKPTNWSKLDRFTVLSSQRNDSFSHTPVGLSLWTTYK